MRDRAESTPSAPPAPDRCAAHCPEFPAWTCGRPPGHPGRHETGFGGFWSDPGAEPDEPDLPALRAIYGHQLRPEDRRTLEALLEFLLELTREAQMGPSGAIDFDLTAAAVDLRFAERYLGYTGRQEGNVLARHEARLADVAERLAPRVGELAGELEAALAAAGAAAEAGQ